MADTTKFVSRVVIKGTIEEVWREITKTDEVQKAMFNSQMRTRGLEPGAQIRMVTPNGKYASVVGEIIEINPPHHLSHTFKFTHLHDPPCVVSYDLKEVEDGVEFTLTSSQVPVGTKTEKSMRQGGDMICKTLKSVVETGKPPAGISMLYMLFKLLGFMTPKSSRSENWPLEQSFTDEALPAKSS